MSIPEEGRLQRWFWAVVGFADLGVTWLVFQLAYSQITSELEFATVPDPEPRRRMKAAGRFVDLLRIQTRHERREFRRWVVIGCTLAFLGTLVVFAEIVAVQLWLKDGAGDSLADFATAMYNSIQSAGIAVSALVIVANVGLVVGLVRVVLRIRQTGRAWAHRTEALVRPRLRSLINAELNVSTPDKLSATSARGLADGEDPTYWIERRGMARIERLVTELGATVVGVSGRRGMGKTTMLRRTISSMQPADIEREPERRQRGPLAILVEAPVDYAPREFLLDMYGQLCESVIAADERARRLVPSAASPVARRIAQAIARLICVAFGIAYFVEIAPPDESGHRYTTEFTRLLVQTAGLDTQVGDGAKILALFGFVAAYYALGLIGRSGVGSLARQATAELAQIRYLQTLQNERGISLASRFGIGLSTRRARQLAQQPMTMPELVRRFRAFAAKVAEGSRDANGVGLIIAIDELDRIADAQAAETLLNQAKATFRVPGCIYLVSVSEEALAQFERRISTTRTAVDTAFDEVVWLPELSLQESIALLERRVTGFPRAYLALCHCLSGGIPRDLVRAARTLVDTGHEDLEPVVKAVISSETTAYLRGVLRDLQKPSAAAHNGNGLLSEEAVLRLLLNDAESQIHLAAATLDARGGRWTSEISAVLSYYAAVEELFVEHRDVVRAAIAEPPDQQAVDMIETLTAVRASLSLSPDLAAEKLHALREARYHLQP
ncbi:P-loop NTPase fold protein [Kribbella sp. NPDC050459]|uniref:P-loop NTPase fold protein n=1 Tax=Kribbella sp. NPDC050459 TaxID=3155785 RepID=UPI003410EFDD